MKKISILCLVSLMLILSGCSGLSKLELIVDAADAGIAAVASAGVPIPAIVVSAIGDVANCVGQQAGSSSPTAQQLLQVGACLSSQALPSLAGVPAPIASLVTALFNDVNQFLQEYPPTATATASAMVVPMASSFAGGSGSSKKIKNLSAKDAKKFEAMKTHAAQVAAKAKALKGQK